MKRKAVCLISDGLDSPIATFLIERSGVEVVGLNFDNKPMVKLSKKKKQQKEGTVTAIKEEEKSIISISPIRNIAQALVNSFQNQTSFELYVVPNGKDLEKIVIESKDPKINCILCKRLMLKKAEVLARNINADYIVTGEILGEQASQTIENLRTIESVLSEKKLIRPNIGLNKEEVIQLSREIGAYKFSEIAAKYTCAAVPIKPATQAHLDRIVTAEKYLISDKMIDTSLQKANKFVLKKNK
ncbi:MAG: hypothetical protein GPJ52_12265 [Candidatus Heimdallarchaeota archaeon]|nr:hypothetical protein [Candidatus Heimdallarchaeota archaeon]